MECGGGSPLPLSVLALLREALSMQTADRGGQGSPPAGPSVLQQPSPERAGAALGVSSPASANPLPPLLSIPSCRNITRSSKSSSTLQLLTQQQAGKQQPKEVRGLGRAGHALSKGRLPFTRHFNPVLARGTRHPRVVGRELLREQ